MRKTSLESEVLNPVIHVPETSFAVPWVHHECHPLASELLNSESNKHGYSETEYLKRLRKKNFITADEIPDDQEDILENMVIAFKEEHHEPVVSEMPVPDFKEASVSEYQLEDAVIFTTDTLVCKKLDSELELKKIAEHHEKRLAVSPYPKRRIPLTRKGR